MADEPATLPVADPPRCLTIASLIIRCQLRPAVQA
jgi:hypothetical protein